MLTENKIRVRLALFEKGPAEQSTPFDFAFLGWRSDLPPNRLQLIHHIQPVSTITDIPLAMLENRDLIGQGRSVSVSRDGLRCRREATASSAIIDNLRSLEG
jgi:hypothetical protein